MLQASKEIGKGKTTPKEITQIENLLKKKEWKILKY